MEIYLHQNGTQYGPYTLKELETFRQANQVTSQDYVIYGDTSTPVDQFLEWARFSPDAAHLRLGPRPQMPPPIPVSPTPADMPIPAELKISGAEHLTINGLAQEIANGGRLVVYPYCVSILILTFRRSSAITLVPAGSDNFAQSFAYTALSMTCGWWGFPWGPIYTVGTLYHSSRGGKDISQEVMAALLQPEHLRTTFGSRKKPHKGKLATFFPWAILLLLLTPVALIFWGVSNAAREDRIAKTTPGAAQFDSANSHLGHKGTIAYGNSPDAIKLATKMSEMLKTIRDNFSTGTKIPTGDFVTYCELHGDTCAFLVYVPELNRYEKEAKTQIGELAWMTGESMVSSLPSESRPKRLAVATRGRFLYDLAWTGPVGEEEKATQKVSGTDSERLMYPFFAAAD